MMHSFNRFSSVALYCAVLLTALVSQIGFGQTLLAAKEKGKKYGYINERGEYVIAPAFDLAGSFSKGVAVVTQGKKRGVINTQGEFTVPPIYDGAQPYAPDAMISVMKAGKWGVIDATGKIIIPLEYEYMSVFKEGFIVAGKFVKRKGYSGIVCPVVLNTKNEIVFKVGDEDMDPEGHECTQLFLPGIANQKTGGYSFGWPMVREGKLILQEAWEGGPSSYNNYKIIYIPSHNSYTFQEGISFPDNYFGFREGALAISMKESIEFGEEGATVGEFYDSTVANSELLRNSIIDFPAQKVHPFFNGVAAVEKDNRWIFVDRDGWIISETQLSTKEYSAYPPMYFNGLIGFWKNGKAGYVDIHGKEVIPFELEEYHPFELDVTPVKKNKLYGLIRKDGTWAILPKFEDLVISPCPCYQ